MNTENDQVHSPTAYASTSDYYLMKDNASRKTKEHSWHSKMGELGKGTQKQYQIKASNKYQFPPIEENEEYHITKA